ncbi:hypothetical protein L596_015604 [Steinernema carpocapsae]|uniref:Uncharacterized protein n=2 Tax=Steinernema carpocapsae TaxID=34508 RepID=A0A4U5NGG8_STECR|nr:hypothetical protein L596_015604 [Steinernema carpocapsae]
MTRRVASADDQVADPSASDRASGDEILSMTFEKVAEFFSDQPADHWDVNHALVHRGKLWLWNRKYVNQHCYNWGHHVSFDGGLYSVFDFASKTWDGPNQFPSVCRAQNMEEILFTLKDSIYLLLYTHFGGVHFGKVFEWDQEARQFKEHSIVESDDGSSIYSAEGDSSKHHLILVDGEDGDSKYFVTFVDHTIRVHELQIDSNQKRCAVRKVAEVPDDVNFRKVQPCQAAYSTGKVNILGGVVGCGFRIESGFLIRVNMEDGDSEAVEVLDQEDLANPNRPPFGFSGASVTAIVGSSWLHITGACPQGMCSSTFCGDIWALENLDQEKPEWRKLDLEVPENGQNAVVAVDAAAPAIFAASPSAGVLRADLA